jgi:hypothetical protein
LFSYVVKQCLLLDYPSYNYSVTKHAGLVACHANFVVAGTAIDRAIILGQEWYLCLGTTLGANDRVHFTGRTFARTPARTTRRTAACCTARWATTRLIHQPFLLVELLFTGCEYEIVSALTAIKGFVFEVQLGTSL